jgi:hypothetical protein
MTVMCLVLPACGGGAGAGLGATAGATSGASFPGLESLEKTNDEAWLLKWPAVDYPGVVYSIFSTAQGASFNFESPLRSVTTNLWKYVPSNVFEDPVCFVVRVQNLKGDENTKSFCTKSEVLSFSGASALKRQADGSHILEWGSIQLEGVIYTIFERLHEDEYTFEQASYDAIRENFYALERPERGVSYCYIVRYAHPSLPEDANTNEVCTEAEAPIEFSGVGGLEALSPTSVRVSWIAADPAIVKRYKIYQGSDFKELLATVDDAASTSMEIESLVPGRQYNFGVRAVDDVDREDRNTLIRPIIMPAE